MRVTCSVCHARIPQDDRYWSINGTRCAEHIPQEFRRTCFVCDGTETLRDGSVCPGCWGLGFNRYPTAESHAYMQNKMSRFRDRGGMGR